MAQTLNRLLSEITLSGDVSISREGVVTIVHKKPRSSKMLRSTFLPADVRVAKTGEAGYVVVRSQDSEYLGVISEIKATSFGLGVAEDEEGNAIYFAPGHVLITGDEEEEEAAPARKAKPGAGKSKAAESDDGDDADADAEPAPKAKAKAGAGRRGRR